MVHTGQSSCVHVVAASLLTPQSIIFVHGLRGHPERTWGHARKEPLTDEPVDESLTATQPRGRKSRRAWFRRSERISRTASDASHSEPAKPFWPYEYLKDDIPQATLWTYGYNSHVVEDLFKANNKNSISQHGRDFSVQLERDVGQGPLIFVAHSLGGIIVKDALRRSKQCRERTKLVIFLGTPHRGSGLADWGRIATNLARLALHDTNSRLVQTLEVNNEVLDNINEQFVNLVDQHRISIHSFHEARGISGVKGLDGKIVEDFSSKLGISQALETVESIDADHRQMTKFTNKDDAGYRAISRVLKQHLRSLSEQSLPEPPVSSSTAPVEAGQQVPAAPEGTVVPVSPCPRQYYIPQLKNERFTGRQDIIEKLQTHFLDPQCRRVALVGLGGVGKTQIAQQIAWWTKRKMPEYSVFWAPVMSEATFEQAYKQIMEKCGITASQDKSPNELVRDYLSSERSGKWLLVVDNADDLDLVMGNPLGTGGIHRFLPTSDQGRILVTTRFRKVAVSLDVSRIVSVSEMSRDEAQEFLQKSLVSHELQDHMTNQEVVDELLKRLTCLPLAIAQAAAYLNQNPITITEYLELLDNTDQDMVELLSAEFYDRTRYPESQSQNPVAKTWYTSFNQIRKIDESAAHLLCFIACIQPKSIPQSLLPETESRQKLTSAIGILCGYSFLSRRTDGQLFDMHSLVHVAIRTWVTERGLMQKTRNHAVEHLASVFPSANWKNHDLWRLYFPHAIKVIDEAQKEHTELRRLWQLEFNVGCCLRTDWRISEAVAMLEHASTLAKKYFTEDHADRISTQQWLADAYVSDDQFQEAIRILDEVATIQEHLAEDNPSRVESQRLLAKVYQFNGQTQESIELLETVVTIKGCLAEDHPIQLASQHELARVYSDNGQTQEAIELLEKVVTIQAYLAEDDPSRLLSQHRLARAYMDNNQTQEAIELLEKVVAIEGCLAEDDPSRLISQYELARVYTDNGQTQEAIELLEHVVEVRNRTPEEIPTENNHAQLVFQDGLAMAYMATDRVQEALELRVHVVAVAKKYLPEHNSSRLKFQHNLAITYIETGQTQEAIELLEKVVAIEASLTEDDSIRLASQYELARVYIKTGQTQEAIELLEKVLAIEASLAEDDSTRLASQYELARVYMKIGQIRDAVGLLEHVVEVDKKTLPKDDPERMASVELLQEALALEEEQKVAGLDE
jgi:tetratricopeptide (TPR) repeat protein